MTTTASTRSTPLVEDVVLRDGSTLRLRAPTSADEATLIDFYRKVRPAGSGWEPIRVAAGIAKGDTVAGDNIPMALLGWVAGCTTIWSALFTVGNFLYGRTSEALVLLAVFAISGVVLQRIVQRLWDASSGE